MGFVDKLKTCAKDPGACAKGIVAGVQASRYNDVKYSRPADTPAAPYQSGASMGHDTRKVVLNAKQSAVAGASSAYAFGESAVHKVGRAAGNVAQRGAEGVGEAWRCRPGSTCAQERSRAKEYRKYGVDPNGPQADETYAEEVRKKGERDMKVAQGKKAEREAKDMRFKNSTAGRTARYVEGVYRETKEVTLAVPKKIQAEGRARKTRQPSVSVAPSGRGRGRPVGSGRGNYSHSGARYSNRPAPSEMGYSQQPQRRLDPIGDIEFESKARVKSLDQQMDKFF